MILICSLVLSVILLLVACFFCFKFAMTILRVQDAIESSLEVLDERYNSMTRILETPLFYDSPEIRRVLEDIKASRDAVLYIANELTDDMASEEDTSALE